MSAFQTLRTRLRIDPYLLLLIATVALAALLPARGLATGIVDVAVNLAVALLFLLYGARLKPEAIWSGLSHWRLQSLIFASTYILFPVTGVVLALLLRGHLPADIVTGLMFLCLLPSTVQSSIAFTSIARGNVPGALCSASLSNSDLGDDGGSRTPISNRLRRRSGSGRRKGRQRSPRLGDARRTGHGNDLREQAIDDIGCKQVPGGKEAVESVACRSHNVLAR